MQEALDKSMELNENVGNDFLESEGANLFFKAAKWAKILAIASLFTMTYGLVYATYMFKNNVLTQFGGLDTYQFFRTLMFLAIDIIKFVPVICILFFSNRYSRAYTSKNSNMAYSSLKSLKLYFFYSFIVLVLIQVLSISSILLYPYLTSTGVEPKN
jgi:hypothetical protein